MSSNEATILSTKWFEVAGKAFVLNCLTDPKRQSDFDANRKTREDLVWESVLSKLADKVEEESRPRNQEERKTPATRVLQN